MTDESLLPRKRPRQARSGATVRVILEAATRVLAAESLAGFNTNRVAEVAGISVGSIYQYFPNKAALVAALIAREQETLAEAIERFTADNQAHPLPEMLAGLVDIALEHQFGNPVFAATIDREEQRLPLDDVIDAAQQRMVTAIHAMFERQSGRTLPRTAAADCLIIVKALVDSEANRTHLDLSALKVRVLRALHGYLSEFEV